MDALLYVQTRNIPRNCIACGEALQQAAKREGTGEVGGEWTMTCLHLASRLSFTTRLCDLLTPPSPSDQGALVEIITSVLKGCTVLRAFLPCVSSSLLEAAATAAAQARSVERAPTRKFHLFKSSSRKLNKGDFPA